MGYRLEVAALLKGKLHNIKVATLPCACEFMYFTRQCWWGSDVPASLLSPPNKPDRRVLIISLQEVKEKVCPLSLVSAKGHLSILSHIFYFPFFFEHFNRLLISLL